MARKPDNRYRVGTLLNATRHWLKHTKINPFQLADKTGLPVAWCRTLILGTTASPSVCRVQLVYEVLTGEKLHVNFVVPRGKKEEAGHTAVAH
jgi:hypothetical protein